MKKFFLLYLMVFAVTFTATGLIDDALEIIIKNSDEVIELKSKKVFRETLERSVKKYGDDALIAAKVGGVDLLEASAKYGDEVMEYAIKNPKAIRALSTNTDEVLKLTKRHGKIVLDLEADRPGITSKIIENFGDDAVRTLGEVKDKKNLTKLLGYAEKADSPKTKKLLYDHYQKGGNKFLDSLDYKTIMALGLSSSMILGTHNVTDGIGEGFKENPEVIEKTFDTFLMRIGKPFQLPLTLFSMVLALLLLIKIKMKLFK